MIFDHLCNVLPLRILARVSEIRLKVLKPRMQKGLAFIHSGQDVLFQCAWSPDCALPPSVTLAFIIYI